MLSRTSLILARAKPIAFARFYGKMTPQLVQTSGSGKRMVVTGALWALTKPKFQTQNSPARQTAAMKMYKAEGNKVIARGRQARAAEAKADKAIKIAARKAGTAKRGQQTEVTKRMQSKRPEKVAKQAKKKKQSKKAVERRSRAKRAARKPSGTTTYVVFRNRVMARSGLAVNKTNSARVLRLWILTGGQSQLSLKGRVNMAVGLVCKSGSKRVVTRTAAKKVAKRPHARKTSHVIPKPRAPKRKPAPLVARSRTVTFTVPPIYAVTPFAGAYVALHKYATGSTPTAKMQSVSRAWSESAFPAGTLDTRTPQQRIRAAADKLHTV